MHYQFPNIRQDINASLPSANYLEEVWITLSWIKPSQRPKLVNALLGKPPSAIAREKNRWMTTAAKKWKEESNGRIFAEPVFFVIQPYWKGRQPDADSMAIISKFILDGAVRPTAVGHSRGKQAKLLAGIIHDDSPRHVKGIINFAPLKVEKNECIRAGLIAISNMKGRPLIP